MISNFGKMCSNNFQQRVTQLPGNVTTVSSLWVRNRAKAEPFSLEKTEPTMAITAPHCIGNNDSKSE